MAEKSIQKICERAKAVIVPEMNMGQFKEILASYTAGKTRIYGINHVGGVPIPPGEILRKIMEVDK